MFDTEKYTFRKINLFFFTVGFKQTVSLLMEYMVVISCAEMLSAGGTSGRHENLTMPQLSKLKQTKKIPQNNTNKPPKIKNLPKFYHHNQKHTQKNLNKKITTPSQKTHNLKTTKPRPRKVCKK